MLKGIGNREVKSQVSSVNIKNDVVENEDLLDYDVKQCKEYTLDKSSSSFSFKDLESFIIGPFTSRFWMLRKHILCMNRNKMDKEAPFYAWECITLQVTGRPDIYLILRNDKIMQMFLTLLAYKIKSMDGQRGTMEPVMKQLYREETKGSPDQTKVKQFERRVKIQHHLVQRVALNYLIIRIKLKLSYTAFVKNMTLKELLLNQILRSHHILCETDQIEPMNRHPLEM